MLVAIVSLLTFTLWGCGASQKTAAPEIEKPRLETEVGDQEKAVSEIEKLGGRIEVETKVQGRPVTRVDFSGTAVADAGLQHLKGLTQLQKLDLGRTQVTDAGLEHVKGLTQLQQLNLDGTHLTNAGIQNLRKALPALRNCR
jgi:hypothetical protein